MKQAAEASLHVQRDDTLKYRGAPEPLRQRRADTPSPTSAFHHHSSTFPHLHSISPPPYSPDAFRAEPSFSLQKLGKFRILRIFRSWQQSKKESAAPSGAWKCQTLTSAAFCTKKLQGLNSLPLLLFTVS